MSSANIIGADFGGIPQSSLVIANGLVSLANGAGPVTSANVNVPFLTANDFIRVYWVSGSNVVGPIVTAVTNPGLSTAFFTLASTGAVLQVGGVTTQANYRWEAVKAPQ